MKFGILQLSDHNPVEQAPSLDSEDRYSLGITVSVLIKLLVRVRPGDPGVPLLL